MDSSDNFKKRYRQSSVLAEKDTRERLLDAATALFAEHGISATTVAKIAARVGVTSAMVHYYFKNRDHLLDAIVEERIMRFHAHVWDLMADSEDDPFTLVKGVVARIIEVADLMPWLPSLWIREIVSEGGLLLEKMLQRVTNEQKNQQFCDCISKSQKQGVINPNIDPRLLFTSIIGLTMLPLAAAKIWHRIPDLAGVSKDELNRHVTALLMQGLVNPAA